MGLYHTYEHTSHGYSHKLYLVILLQRRESRNPSTHAPKKERCFHPSPKRAENYPHLTK
ncbi:hypothetical protein Krac_9824 [Ktedonobacter racemifer DSM 44963]|uniref:Uncharacterized protein n=1 Tax=Ktedonobacter racemifer DSM 44963 TaxID=485913 RepID=D6TE03_KTERA|nr:hypothetical protein Krac_9824 [Ktedonobacter racemifer DSM 44963]